MRGAMSLESKRELTVAISERYRAADRKSKKVILDEFAKVTGYHRKHAIRVLRKGKPVVERKSDPQGCWKIGGMFVSSVHY